MNLLKENFKVLVRCTNSSFILVDRKIKIMLSAASKVFLILNKQACLPAMYSQSTYDFPFQVLW